MQDGRGGILSGAGTLSNLLSHPNGHVSKYPEEIQQKYSYTFKLGLYVTTNLSAPAWIIFNRTSFRAGVLFKLFLNAFPSGIAMAASNFPNQRNPNPRELQEREESGVSLIGGLDANKANNLAGARIQKRFAD